jgi:hypothetical protein
VDWQLWWPGHIGRPRKILNHGRLSVKQKYGEKKIKVKNPINIAT